MSEEKQEKNNTLKQGFFQKVWNSITKIEKYPDMAAEGLGRAFTYICKIVAILAIVLCLGTIYQTHQMLQEGMKYLKEEFPEFTYQEGRLDVSSDERLTISEEDSYVGRTIIDTKTEEEQVNEKIRVSRVKILDAKGEDAIGKPVGSYITVDLKGLKTATEEEIEKASNVVTKELRALIEKHIGSQDSILVVGLGNEQVTPDALGPKVATQIDVTRHILNYMPEVLESGTREVSAVSPGVLGTTGIETQEILKGIVDHVKPKLVIVIDALASKSIERISSTVQIADTGIVPGAGVGNTRKELSEQSLGVPVVAVGIPTVVDLATITDDCLDLFITKLQEEAKSNEYLNSLKEQDNYEEIKEALVPNGYNMIVTPKEIDDLIENMSSVVARGINFAM